MDETPTIKINWVTVDGTSDKTAQEWIELLKGLSSGKKRSWKYSLF